MILHSRSRGFAGPLGVGVPDGSADSELLGTLLGDGGGADCDGSPLGRLVGSGDRVPVGGVPEGWGSWGWGSAAFPDSDRRPAGTSAVFEASGVFDALGVPEAVGDCEAVGDFEAAGFSAVGGPSGSGSVVRPASGSRPAGLSAGGCTGGPWSSSVDRADSSSADRAIRSAARRSRSRLASRCRARAAASICSPSVGRVVVVTGTAPPAPLPSGWY